MDWITEWSKVTRCKRVDLYLRRFEPYSSQYISSNYFFIISFSNSLKEKPSACGTYKNTFGRTWTHNLHGRNVTLYPIKLQTQEKLKKETVFFWITYYTLLFCCGFKKPKLAHVNNMQIAGLEPARGLDRFILSKLRLPISSYLLFKFGWANLVF